MSATQNNALRARIGKLGEDAACRFLEENGYEILGRNVRYDHKELDIIAQNSERLVFVEVKSRVEVRYPEGYAYSRYAGSAVTAEKKRNTALAAKAYLREHKPDRWVRIDVIEVYFASRFDSAPSRIVHIKNAFGDQRRKN